MYLGVPCFQTNPAQDYLQVFSSDHQNTRSAKQNLMASFLLQVSYVLFAKKMSIFEFIWSPKITVTWGFSWDPPCHGILKPQLGYGAPVTLVFLSAAAGPPRWHLHRWLIVFPQRPQFVEELNGGDRVVGHSGRILSPHNFTSKKVDESSYILKTCHDQETIWWFPKMGLPRTPIAGWFLGGKSPKKRGCTGVVHDFGNGLRAGPVVRGARRGAEVWHPIHPQRCLDSEGVWP